jgi:ankyrin repeat protein
MTEQLIEAAEKGDLETVVKLLDQGLDPFVEGRYGWTALTAAGANNHWDIVKELLNRNPDRKNLSKVLIMAAEQDKKELMKELLEQGADPNWDWDGTAMTRVARNGDLELLRLLINYGGIVDENVIDDAYNSHAEEIIEFIKEYPKWENLDPGVTQLMYLASLGIPPLIEKHLEKIQNHPRKMSLLNQQDMAGFTALHYATLGEEKESVIKVIKALIAAGADLDLQDDAGNTARDYIKNDPELSQILLTN